MVLSGFNTEFKHRGTVFHVQTEDNGVNNPQVVTLLYLKGAILASKKSSYEHLLKHECCQAEVMDLMKDQHRQMMKDVIAGKYDNPQKRDTAPAAVKEPVPEALMSLDEAILDYLNNYGAGGKKRPDRLSAEKH